MLKKVLLLIAIIISFDAYARASSVPLVDPAPVLVSSTATSASIEKAIVASGVRRHWVVVDRQPGVITLRYAARGFSVTVKTQYDGKSVTIKYSDSTDLDYGMEGGVAVIHPNYNRWVNNLAHDIAAELSASSVK